MTWQSQLKGDSLAWLLEDEPANVRYLALRDLVDDGKPSPAQQRARRQAYAQGPIPKILSKMNPEGWWKRPGSGYGPKYRSAVWSLLMLAQLGARARDDKRIATACAYLLDHAMCGEGQFSASTTLAPSGMIDCLQGNLCWSLLALGYEDPRIDQAFEWMARSVTGEGVAPKSDKKAALRYYSAKCGPDFACGPNWGLPCAWGAVKVMMAFSKLPRAKRTPLIERAMQHGVDFLLGVDPAEADYPRKPGNRTSGDWWKFGFPVFYITDLLQIVEALLPLGYGRDRRLKRSLELIRSKQDEKGRWSLELDYKGKTWVSFGKKREPNKWVTLRALRVLKAVG